MMNITKLLFNLLILSVCLAGCVKEKHLISDPKSRAEVENAFSAKQQKLPHGDLFAIFNQTLLPIEKEALTFLYAYAPIGDITDYDGEFYLKNVRSSIQAKEEMPWGDSIPEDIFRHFVLPVRVNNENLDESRTVFYQELKDRVKGLSLYDAVLEVNHWCHEKVIYTPSDARTSSPLASVKTAYGRCGEESVFTVAALRSVGIPARQVYTPRWAHSDDNHAWVEAWVNGKWFFLGACEPEPVLNLGWFNGPAYRGMLMHTKVFGHYNGPEEVMDVTECYTEINVIDNYAPTAKASVKVVDTNGAAIEGADVEFKIYNYAEFYTVANKKSNKDGQCSLSAGKGDMLVWATKDGMFGFSKLSFGKEESINIVLDKKPGDAINLPLDIVPPVEGSIPAEVTDEQKAENARRMQEEDVIRNKYVSTFYTEEKALALAKELGIDGAKATHFLIDSRGNWATIEKFLNSSKENINKAVALLDVISAKDLRDISYEVLTDNFNNTTDGEGKTYESFVLNPRVSNEMVTAYKSYLQKEVNTELASQAKANPQVLVEWTQKNITTNDSLNPQRVPIMPIGVWRAKVADVHSRNIFFVALARSLNIPARIESVARKVQYYANDTWNDVDFEAAAPIIAEQGTVVAKYPAIKTLDDPKYHSNFTIAKILPDGKLQTLNFRSGGNVDMGLGDTWSRLLKQPLTMDKGNYLLITGNRMAKGNVLSNISSFNIEPGKATNTELIMRESSEEVQVIGSVDSEAKFKLANTGEETSILLTSGRGYFIVAVIGARQEPTNHAMRDLAAMVKEFEAWDRSIILLFKDEQSWKNFDAAEFGVLPKTITFGIDINNNVTNMLAKSMNLSDPNNLPIFVIGDTFNRAVFVSQGYTIGLGEQMMKVIRKL